MCREIPVLSENLRQLRHYRTDHPQMEIPAGCLLATHPIFIGDIHATSQGDLSIHDHQFPVIAQIEMKSSTKRRKSAEPRKPPTTFFQFPEKTSQRAGGSYLIQQHPHLHSAGGRSGEGIPHRAAGFIHGPNIKLQMHVMLCLRNIPKQLRKKAGAIHEQFPRIPPGGGKSIDECQLRHVA